MIKNCSCLEASFWNLHDQTSHIWIKSKTRIQNEHIGAQLVLHTCMHISIAKRKFIQKWQQRRSPRKHKWDLKRFLTHCSPLSITVAVATYRTINGQQNIKDKEGMCNHYIMEHVILHFFKCCSAFKCMNHLLQCA
jgi:hypothetical protein